MEQAPPYYQAHEGTQDTQEDGVQKEIREPLELQATQENQDFRDHQGLNQMSHPSFNNLEPRKGAEIRDLHPRVR